jgi:methionyl-tRNA formyltransferase
MRVVFFGSSFFSSRILNSIYKEGVEFPLVVTKEPKEKGRGRRKQPTPVGIISRKFSLPLIEIDNPNTAEVEGAIKKTGVDVLLLASYGAILKNIILETVKYPLNIHPSLLPKYRGVAPIRRAIMNNETKTGITIFIMDEKVDAGGIILKKEVDINQNEVASELEERLADISAETILPILEKIESGELLNITKQEEDEAIYASKILKEELEIDWKESALKVAGKINGLSYNPGAFTFFRGKRIKVLRARPLLKISKTHTHGEIIDTNDEIIVSCGDGAIGVSEIQVPGKKIMDARSFINGYHIKVGEKLG